MFAAGDIVAQRYRLIHELGHGGLGVVWEAEDQRLDRQVALKAIIPKLARDPKKLERFEINAKAVARLRSPHIVQLLDYGVDRAPYMVMELLHGAVLRDRFLQGERFELDAAARIVVQIAKALAAAHEQGVVHRNLKPANIFLIEDHGDQFVKVFDFGTAKWVTGFRDAKDVTTMGAIMGAPEYLAPEQLSGDERSDHRADVWALGAIAYHCVTGVKPFEGEQMGELMRSILFNDPPPPSALDSRLSRDIDDFFKRALNRNRDERFQSARELGEALCHAVGVTGSFGITTPRSSDRRAGGEAYGSEAEDRELDEVLARDLIVTRDEKSQPSSSERSHPPVESAPPSSGPGPGSLDDGPSVDPRASVDTPARAALVRPVKARRRTSPLEHMLRSVPVGGLVLGAALALLLGGAAAWVMFRSPSPRSAVRPEAPADVPEPASARRGAPDGSVTPAVTGAPSSASSARPPPQPSDRTSPNGSASAAPAPRVVVPGDGDIYELPQLPKPPKPRP